MTKYLTPRSDSVSVKIIEPSDFEKFFTSDLVRDHKISGFTLSGGTGLTVNVTLGEARLKGLHLESTASETVSGLTASDVNYIYVKLARDSNSEAESWDFDKNISGVTPTDAFFIGTATTNGSTVTSVDQTDVVTTISDNDGYSDVYYGDGSDGDDVVISSSTTFGTIKQYNKSLTINSGVNITPTATENTSITILVDGTFTLNGTINMNGKGGKGATATGSGGKGGTSGSGKQDGNDGHQGEKGNKGLNCGGSGGTGGQGGSGGGGSSGAGPGNGAIGTGKVSCELNLIKTKPNILSKSLPQFYGCGGSSGSGGGGGQGGANSGTHGGSGGSGGAGGDGGGGVLIVCRTFNNNGSITANATNGTNGSGGANGGGTVNGEDGGSGGKSGGGGGGEGGTIVIAYQTLTALGTVTATAGTAGSTGGGQGTATAGTAGSAGVITQVSIT